MTIKELVFLCFLIILALPISAQEVSGNITAYGEAIEDVEVYNVNKDKTTYSDQKGQFIIKAELRDTLVFRFSFFKESKKVVDSLMVEHGLELQIEQEHFDLEEVFISTTPIEFDTEEHNDQFKNVLLEDIKNRPYLYTPPVDYTGGADLLGLTGLLVSKVIDLIKKEKEPETIPIAFEDLEHLFKNSSFFTEELLSKELKIKPGDKYLFYDYCEAQDLDADLLKAKNQFLLLNALIELSKKFKKASSE